MKRIRLAQNYRNASGVIIPAGDYWADDPALKGQGTYLIETRHAEVLAEVRQPESPPPPEETGSEKANEAFKKFNLERLNAIVKDNNVELDGATKKDDIIVALVKAGVEPPEA